MSNASKKCSKCGQVKSLDEFSPDRRAKDGRGSQCKSCQSARARKRYEQDPEKARAASRRYRRQNPDKVREGAQRYRDANAEKVREATRRWREQNADKVREYSRQYYRRNADQRREYRREWRRRNPEAARRQKRKWRESNLEVALEKERERLRRWRSLNRERDRAAQRRREAAFRLANPERAREKSRQSKQRWRARRYDGSGYRVTAKDIRRLASACCVACGLPADSLDHVIPLSRGGSHGVGNLAPMCRTCNSSKGAKTISEWRKANDWLPLGSFPRRKDRADGAA